MTAFENAITEDLDLNILNGVQTTTDYPYGRLRCTMSFSTEFKKNKGYRTVRQSVNPKNSRVNKPKKSTYADFYCVTENAENGHYEFWGLDIRDIKSAMRLINLVQNHDIDFDSAQTESLVLKVYAAIRMNIIMSSFDDDNKKELLACFPLKEMLAAYRNGDSLTSIARTLNFDYTTYFSLIK